VEEIDIIMDLVWIFFAGVALDFFLAAWTLAVSERKVYLAMLFSLLSVEVSARATIDYVQNPAAIHAFALGCAVGTLGIIVAERWFRNWIG
jgi:hypothetical protein